MHRRGGKRIRMDEPPPEYENPMTPQVEQDHYGGAYIQQGMYGEAYGEQAGQSSDGAFESPPTPGTRRVTRSKARGATNPPPVAAPSYSPTSTGHTGRGRGRGRPPGRKNNVGEIIHTLDDESSLYHIIKSSKVSLTNIVDDWIESYKINREAALISLMQFFINAAGCKGRITQQMQSTMEHAAIIRKMTEEFDEESGEYPLIMAGQTWKKFRQNFCDFVQTLVKQCQYTIIYDQFLMDNVISLLTGLSDSQVRAFRHTATLGAMKLMTALVDVALTVSVNLDNTQRQYEAERQKTREKRASDRLEALLGKRQELEENMDEIKNMLTYMFKSVFVHRYRDTLPEIRAIAMTEIGVWMHKFHANFLDDSYLKYIGWTLHDKVGEVRLRCLQALQPLYASEELKGKLELFTNKFKDRIVAMTLDKEYDVAVQAVRLVISILKHHHEILTDKDCEHVYELVYSSHRAVAQAAGEFLNERLFQPGDMDAGKTKRGKRRLPNTPFIRDLVQFFIESELHEHAAYLVDSLIESNTMMKDWECMTDLLLEEPGLHEEPLDNRQETSLIEIMVCCVKQAASGEAPVGRGPTRKVSSLREMKQAGEDKQKLTEHFIVTLPPLLDKYSADPEKLANLLSIPQYFDLDLYTSGRQDGSLQALLVKLKYIVQVHHEPEVLETLAKTLEILCTEGHSIYTRCDVARSTIVDMIVASYKEAIDDWRNLLLGEETPNADEIFNVVSSLKKVSMFYACHNLNQWSLWDTLFQDFKDTESGLPPEALKYCISSCYYDLLWGLRDLEVQAENGSLTHSTIQNLRNKLDDFIEASQMLIRSSPHVVIKEEAYVGLCDLLIVFSEQLQSQQSMIELVCRPDRNLQMLLNEFVQTYVFVPEQDSEHDEHRIEELHRRRNFLAAYCKLIVYNIMPTKAAADVFKHYVKYYNDYGDIIKATLSKAREINKVNCALTMCLSLNMMFNEVQRLSGGRNARQHEEFFALKELAKRFALSFGLDAVKNREAITALHRAGILFAVTGAENSDDPTGPPANLPFLEILSEFTNKLLKQDKRVVMSFLDRRITTGMPSSRGEDWQPLLLYRNSLLHGETDQLPTTSKRAYGRKRHKDPDSDHDQNDDLSDQEFPGNLYAERFSIVQSNITSKNPIFLNQQETIMADTLVLDWLDEFESLTESEIHTYSIEQEHNHEVMVALYNVLSEPHKYKSDNLIDGICQQLLNFYRSGEENLRRFAMQFIPTLVFLHLSEKSYSAVQTLLVSLYNLEVIDSKGQPRTLSFRIPSIAQSSIFHDSTTLEPAFIAENSLRRWEECNTKLVSWGPLPQVECLNAQNRQRVVTALVFLYNQQLSNVITQGIEQTCKGISRLVTQGFSSGTDSARSSITSDSSFHQSILPRIPVSSPLLVELLHIIYHAAERCAGVAIQALHDIIQRANYESYPDVILAASAIKNLLQHSPTVCAAPRPSHSHSVSKSMITNASFRTKKLPDDIPIQDVNQQPQQGDVPLDSISEEQEDPDKGKSRGTAGARKHLPKLPGLSKKHKAKNNPQGEQQQVEMMGGGDQSAEFVANEANHAVHVSAV